MRHDNAASTRPLTAIAAADDRRHAGRIAVILFAQFAMLVALMWVVLGVVMAHADDRSGRILAYAEPMQERFAAPFEGQHGLETAYADEIGHPLNDAWMGLNVVTADGRIAGYVSDAFIGPDGSVDEIIVTPADGAVLGHPVYVPAGQVTYRGLDVQITATLAQLARYEPVTDDLAGFVH